MKNLSHLILTTLLLIPLTTPTQAAEPAPLPDPQTVIKKIAFGSCFNQNFKKNSPVWNSINEEAPQLYLALGDNVYADTSDMEKLQSAYDKLTAIPDFQKLYTTIPILPTWDDHDYGNNDSGADWPAKKDSQKKFLKFFGIPRDDERWQRDGIYHAATFGPEGKRVQIIMLDTRYFRSPIERGPKPTREPGQPGAGPYQPHTDTNLTILGEAQWQWLEERLREPAELRLIASSIVFIPPANGWEAWAIIPHERERMLNLIAKTQAHGVLFLSGDHHVSEFSRLEKDDPTNPCGYPIYDFTSSGLNMASDYSAGEPNPYRIGENNITVNSYGVIEIDWEGTEEGHGKPMIQLRIAADDGSEIQTEHIFLENLKPHHPTASE